jgi:hypothetical protein
MLDARRREDELGGMAARDEGNETEDGIGETVMTKAGLRACLY